MLTRRNIQCYFWCGTTRHCRYLTHCLPCLIPRDTETDNCWYTAYQEVVYTTPHLGKKWFIHSKQYVTSKNSNEMAWTLWHWYKIVIHQNCKFWGLIFVNIYILTRQVVGGSQTWIYDLTELHDKVMTPSRLSMCILQQDKDLNLWFGRISLVKRQVRAFISTNALTNLLLEYHNM